MVQYCARLKVSAAIKHEGANQPMLSESRLRPTNEQEATRSLLEILRQDKQKDILLWLRTPRSDGLLSRCEVAKVTPRQVANPETLLPHVARAFWQLSQWILYVGFRICERRRENPFRRRFENP